MVREICCSPKGWCPASTSEMRNKWHVFQKIATAPRKRISVLKMRLEGALSFLRCSQKRSLLPCVSIFARNPAKKRLTLNLSQHDGAVVIGTTQEVNKWTCVCAELNYRLWQLLVTRRAKYQEKYQISPIKKTRTHDKMLNESHLKKVDFHSCSPSTPSMVYGRRIFV